MTVRDRAAELIAGALHGAPAAGRTVFYPPACPTCARALELADQLEREGLLAGPGPALTLAARQEIA